jgi:hypothetical protein
LHKCGKVVFEFHLQKEVQETSEGENEIQSTAFTNYISALRNKRCIRTKLTLNIEKTKFLKFATNNKPITVINVS